MLGESNLYSYQKIIKDWITEHPYCGVFADMGLGKTISVLTALNSLMFEELEVSRVLIVAPKRVVLTVWHKEIEKWSHVNHLSITRVIGNQRQRIAALQNETDIHIVSKDNLVWLINQFGGSRVPYDALVIDESSAFKNSKTKRFKAIRKIMISFNRVVLLTGTPTPQSFLDLWSQIYLLDGGERLGKFIDRYRNKYFNPGQRRGDIVYSYNIKDMADKEILRRIGDICISLKKEDFPEVDIPEVVYNNIEVQLSSKVKNMYEEFEREQIIQFLEDNEDAVITAENGAGLMIKLCQFANGAVYENAEEDHKGPRLYQTFHDEKLDALEELIESLGGKNILVQYSYRHDLYRIKERLKKYGPRELKTEQDVDDWNAGKIKVMCMHPAGAGHGINLQFGGHYMVWFGLSWNLEYYLQANARLPRPGQEHTTFIHHLICKGTYDEAIIKALKSKDKKQEILMQALKKKIDRYAKA